MKIIAMIGICAVSLLIGACASNVTKVREQAGFALNCENGDVAVELVARPMVGTTRYQAAGCGSSITYECYRDVWFYGLPISEGHCKRTKS